ncbi:hypothetical protein DFH08DRAFT_698470, partial [Mycena albidolilacea]
APFDCPDEDLVLGSAEGVDFRVHRAILATASPFFRIMLSLPPMDNHPGVAPVVPVTETAPVLDRLLRFRYPGAEPLLADVETLDNLRETLKLLLFKYHMLFIAPRGKDRLRTYTEAQPLSVFSLACRYGWADVAIDAARFSLKLRLRFFDHPSPAELKYTSADTFYSLLSYHSRCGVAASAVTELSWYSVGPEVWFSCPACPFKIVKVGLDTRALPELFLAYLRDAAKLISSHPGSSVEDPKLVHNAVHKMVECTHCRYTLAHLCYCSFDLGAKFIGDKGLQMLPSDYSLIHLPQMELKLAALK